MRRSLRLIVNAFVCGGILLVPFMVAGQPQDFYDLTTFRPAGAVFDLEVNGDQLIFPDHVTRSVFILDGDLKLKRRIEDIETPHHVAVSTDGSFYVSTYRDGHILKFRSDFVRVPDWDRQLSEHGHIKAPLAMVADGEGNLLVTDWLRPAVLKVSPEGALIEEFDISRFASQEFKPHSIELVDERVFVADMGTAQTVHEFDKDGSFIKSWEKPVANFMPSSISLIQENMMAVVNSAEWTIHLFDLGGKHLKAIDYIGRGPKNFHNVADIESDRKGIIYTSEWAGSRIQKFRYESFVSGCQAQGGSC